MRDPESRPEAVDHDEPDADDESAVDRMRGSGAGVEDPNIVGRAKPGTVEDHVQEDEPPQV